MSTLRIFDTYAELSAAYALPADAPGAYRSLAAFRCDDCNAIKMLPKSDGTGCASGYALTPKPHDRMVCYICADAQQREDLRDRSRSFGAYLASDGRTIATWTGGELGRVIWSNPCTLTRRSFWHDSRSYRSVRVRDVHGAYWFGRGSPGVCITLRPCKG
jgi:hypothetical protein